MRIISGQFKGRRFEPPINITARPTTDFAKEGLFNVLVNSINFEESNALDLFSGTGSISYELISRGCPNVTAVEMSIKHISFIHKVINQLNIDNLHILQTDVFRFIENTSQTFDLIFADPPYQLENINAIPDLIFKNHLLKEDGLLVVEHGKTTNFEKNEYFLQERNYGNVHFSFFAHPK